MIVTSLHVEDVCRRAFAFIQCFFDISLDIDTQRTEFEAETESEKEDIGLPYWDRGKRTERQSLHFSMLSRALWAAEEGHDVSFTASLSQFARLELFSKRYIDSFRYSFLLIEARYGEGQFRSQSLKNAFVKAPELVRFAVAAIAAMPRYKDLTGSTTRKLLDSGPDGATILRHLVDERGRLFHGNLARIDAWSPHEQQSAEALAFLAMEIVANIGRVVAAPMFAESLASRHLESARKAGATMSLLVEFIWVNPNEEFARKGQMRMLLPGTHITRRMAVEAAKNFLAWAEDSNPVAGLVSAKCAVTSGPEEMIGQDVFEIKIHSGQKIMRDAAGHQVVLD